MYRQSAKPSMAPQKPERTYVTEIILDVRKEGTTTSSPVVYRIQTILTPREIAMWIAKNPEGLIGFTNDRNVPDQEFYPVRLIHSVASDPDAGTNLIRKHPIFITGREGLDCDKFYKLSSSAPGYK